MSFRLILNVDDSPFKHKLATLVEAVQRRIIRKAARDALRIARRAIQQQTKIRSVKRSIGIRIKITSTRSIAKVGVNVGKKPISRGQVTAVHRTQKDGTVRTAISPRFQVPQAVFIGAGTKPRYHKSGKYTGFVTKDNFVQRGWAASKSAVLAKYNESMLAGIRKVWESNGSSDGT